MSYEINLRRALDELRQASGRVKQELQDYSAPASETDAHYCHLIGQQSAIDDAIHALATPRSVPTYAVQEGLRAERQ